VKAQAKTPQQRKANALYEKREASKRGKPTQPKQEVKKVPISQYWIGMQCP
jgi:Ribosome associated membrane protein RAMP4